LLTAGAGCELRAVVRKTRTAADFVFTGTSVYEVNAASIAVKVSLPMGLHFGFLGIVNPVAHPEEGRPEK